MDIPLSYPGPLQQNNPLDHLEVFEHCFPVLKQGETMTRWAQKEGDWFRR